MTKLHVSKSERIIRREAMAGAALAGIYHCLSFGWRRCCRAPLGTGFVTANITAGSDTTGSGSKVPASSKLED